MYRKPGITFVGILLLAGGIILAGTAIHQMRKTIIERNNKPIVQDSIVSAPTPDFSTPVPVVIPSESPSIADINPGIRAENPLPKTGPEAGLVVVGGMSGLCAGAAWYSKRRTALRQAAQSVTIQ